PRIILSDFLSHLIGSMIIKSVALHFYGYPWSMLILRIPIYLGVIVLESAVILLLLRSSILQKEIARIRK
ncbi:MAG: folate family ECF transporter S component, partial [Clostridia bacterium]|nr:folate family ECF transporter S component [Clostridia bacterium]